VRIQHWLLMSGVVLLVLTGFPLRTATLGASQALASFFGGMRVLPVVHRAAAFLLISAAIYHLGYLAWRVSRRDLRFSMIPAARDLSDAYGNIAYFLGLRKERPKFAAFSYIEKFDYWAVFWGVSIIGFSGLMLAFPHITAIYLPGWVFNVATIVHGEEAFLAAVFLFTVHFFNNHFRPDKLPPPDIVMFTGTQSLEEFRREHPAQYQRLVDAGELDKYLVDAPSRPMTLGSKILGLILIAAG
jgi:cytochrome b subunit of formate dehydrogenase